MKPSRVSAELRKIASGIDNCSTKVRPDLVSRDLRRVLAAMDTDTAGNGSPFILVHVWGDGSGIYTESTNITPPDGKYMNIGLPNSDDQLFVVHQDVFDNPDFIKEQFKDHLWDDALEHVSGHKVDEVAKGLGVDLD